MSGAPTAADSLVEAALKVLQQPDPWLKAQYTQTIVQLWRSGQMQARPDSLPAGGMPVPKRPARADDKVRLLAPHHMPKLGKGGSLSSRQAIVHSLCHIESWAVDLAWDVIARWGADAAWCTHLPRQFYDDFVQVADDECRHFLLLEARLQAMGSHYGALPAHDGLWESASRTSDSLAARLVVEHCVHEARGLDVLPGTIAKFRNNGDADTAALLEGIIYPEEVTHCAAGVRWLRHLHAVACAQSASAAPADSRPNGHDSGPANQGCSHDAASQPAWVADKDAGDGARDRSWMKEAGSFSAVELWFHHLARSHFAGTLKPPFNLEARRQAGFEESWFLPLASDSTDHLPPTK